MDNSRGALLTFPITDGIFYLPEILIDFFGPMDQRRFNVELKIAEGALKGIKSFRDIFQGRFLRLMSFALGDGDLANEESQEDGCTGKPSAYGRVD